MSGISFLSPGVRVMRRLRLGGKLVVLAGAAVCPLMLWWGLSRWPSVAGWAPLAALGGLAVLGYLMLSFHASFMHDFRRVFQHMELTAGGNLRSALSVQGHDELADLARLLDRMTGGLSAMVAEVRSNSALVAHAGQSLAAGNRDLAERTEQLRPPAQVEAGRHDEQPRPSTATAW